MRHQQKPLRAEDMTMTGNLFGIRLVPGGSTGLVELYVEDDGWFHFKASFDRLWLPDLRAVVDRASAAISAKT